MTQNIRRGTCFGCVCRSASVCQSKRGSLVRRRTNFHESDQSLLPPAKRPAMSEFGHSIYSSVWRQFYRSRCVEKVGFQAIRLSMITSEELLYFGRSQAAAAVRGDPELCPTCCRHGTTVRSYTSVFILTRTTGRAGFAPSSSLSDRLKKSSFVPSSLRHTRLLS